MNKMQLRLIRRTIAISRNAREKGNHPFGSLLSDADGNILLEAENTVITNRDCTGHAETNLMRLATQKFAADFLANCTLYTSAEPCPMCAGAIYWGNVRTIVFGLGSKLLAELFTSSINNPPLHMTCSEIFARGGKTVQIIGPILEAEAAKEHEGFWT